MIATRLGSISRGCIAPGDADFLAANRGLVRRLVAILVWVHLGDR
jgi:hypothetical protein